MVVFAKKLSDGESVTEKSGPPDAKNFSISVNVNVVCKSLLALLSIIVIVHSFLQIIRFSYGMDHLLGLTPLFYMYAEQNIPTWFSGALLLTCSILLAAIASAKAEAGDRFRYYWWFLCLIFIFLSIDEIAAIHEKVGGAFEAMLPYSIPSAWLFPYMVIGIFVVIFLARFLFSMPRKYRILFILSGLVYVGGAAGLEVLEVIHVLGGGANDPVFVLLVTIEEVMELGGATLFIFSLLNYIKDHVGEVRIIVR